MIVAGETRTHRPSTLSRAAQPLREGAHVDVCIVGADLAGMIAAYLLARAGRHVMVIDEGPVGGLHGGFEAAHLASVPEKPFAAIEARQGRSAARLAAQAGAAAIDALEAIALRERIACEFERVDGYRVASLSDPPDEMQRELEAARRAGVAGAELLESPPIEGAGWGTCVRYPGQAHFHPARFLAGLARAIQRDGGRIDCAVRCRSIEAGKAIAVVTADGRRIEAGALAGSRPLRRDGAFLAPPPPRVAHMVGLRIARGSVPHGLYWESADPTRWVRLRSQGSGAGEVLLVAAEDPPGDDDHTAYRYLALEEWARRRFPAAGEVVQRFTGELVQTSDVFALAARGECDSDSVYVATGDWGTPLARGAIAGLAIKDFVEGAQSTPWADLYVPEACYVPGKATRPL